MTTGNSQPGQAVTSDAADVKNPPRLERRTYNVEEAGEILGLSRGAIYRRVKDGSVPTIRLGNRLLVPKAALEKLLTPA